MAFAGNTLSLIRAVFKRDTVLPVGPSYFDSVSTNALSYTNVTLGPQNGYNDYLTDSVKLDQDLMSRYADYEDMDDYPELGCISGDSLVRTLDGPVRIKDLAAKYKAGEVFKIIAYDRESRRFVVADAHSPRLTKNGKVIEVQFDNGMVLRCTPDHKILTRKGVWKEAKDLGIGESVMPLETKLACECVNHKVIRIIECQETEDVYDLTTERYHNFVANGVVVHNSALNLYADDATVQDIISGKSIWFESEDTSVEGILDDMLNVNLNIEDNLWEIARSLVKYGNNFEEIMVIDGKGVVKLNHIPAPSIRRIEDVNGIQYGFIHDPTMVFRMDTKTFMERLKDKSTGDLSPSPYSTNYHDMMQVYEPWEMVHFRLRGKSRKDLYGYSVLEPARWVWKRLTMLEDAMLLQKLCLRGDSKIWTPGGYKFIKDINEGDEVYCFDDRQVKKTKVIYKKHNGKDTIYRISSMHRDLYANSTHPVLVEEIENRGKGKPRLHHLKYVEVKNLIPQKHRFVTPSKPAEDAKLVRLKLPSIPRRARLKESMPLVVNTNVLHQCGVDLKYATDFFYNNGSFNERAAVSLVTANGLDPNKVLEFYDDWGGCEKVSLPEFISEDFARWFGFMLGDGYVTCFKDKNGFSHRRVGFSCGDKEFMNKKYRDLFEKFVGKVKFGGDSGHRFGYYQVGSKQFAEFMELNGFIPGAHNKRLPEWAFQVSDSIKMALIRGFIDADGHVTPRTISSERGRVSYERGRIELCNKDLVDDFRMLSMQMGLTVSKTLTRFRKGNGRTIKGSSKPLSDHYSYQCDIVFKPQDHSEKIMSIEEVGDDDIWDIGVESDAHNFIADGVVVHNTRAPQRYAYYVDVGDVPPNQARSFVNKIKNDFKKTKFIDPNTGKPSFRYNPMCLGLATRIPLLDGSIKTLDQLIKDHENGVKNWVYSIDSETKNIVPGEVSWAGITRKNADVIKVTLDNCSIEIVTPDHKFMLRNGSYVEAKDLKIGMSLMPFNRGIHCQTQYEYVVHPGETGWDAIEQTHRLVARCFGDINGMDVHHVDEMKRNNYPDNLMIVTREEHAKIHGFFDAWNKTEEHSKQASENNRKYGKGKNIVDYNFSSKHTEDNEMRKVFMKRWRDDAGEEHNKKLRIKFTESLRDWFVDEVRKNPIISIDALCKLFEESGGQVLSEFRNANTRKIESIHRHLILSSLRYFGYENFREFKRSVLHNHKVVSIEVLSQTMDTGCITVERWHNFALASGVFVKNSLDEDIFVPVRKGKRSTDIEVLSGPDGQQTDDAEYFRDKLFAALAIPKSYLGGDDTVGRNNLAQQDVRFARTIMRIQREMKNGFAQVGKVELSAKNIDPSRVQYGCHMVIPSGVFELAQMEIQKAKLDLSEQYKNANFSEYYIWSKILGLSDEDINTIQQQRAREGESNLDAEEAGMVRELMPKAIDKAGDTVDKKAVELTSKILSEIHKENTSFGKRISELKLLTTEIKHAVHNQKYYRGRKGGS